MKLIEQSEYTKLDLCERRRYLLEAVKYLDRFPAAKYGSKEFDLIKKRLTSFDFCAHLSQSIYTTLKYLVMKTKPSKKTEKEFAHLKPKKKASKNPKFDSVANSLPHFLYELYRTKSGAWKFRKRAANGEILNHSYNSKAGAIKGMKADFELTKELTEFRFKEVK